MSASPDPSRLPPKWSSFSKMVTCPPATPASRIEEHRRRQRGDAAPGEVKMRKLVCVACHPVPSQTMSDAAPDHLLSATFTGSDSFSFCLPSRRNP
jgi:hypothetical protein